MCIQRCMAAMVVAAGFGFFSLSAADGWHSFAESVQDLRRLIFRSPEAAAFDKSRSDLGRLEEGRRRVVDFDEIVPPMDGQKPGDPCDIVYEKAVRAAHGRLLAALFSGEATADSDSDASFSGVADVRPVPSCDGALIEIEHKLLPAYKEIEYFWQYSIRDKTLRSEIRQYVCAYRLKEQTSGGFDVKFVQRRWRRWMLALHLSRLAHGYTEDGRPLPGLSAFLALISEELTIEEGRTLIPPNVLKTVWDLIAEIIKGPPKGPPLPS